MGKDVMPGLETQFLCSDVSKFIKEMQELIDKYTSDSSLGNKNNIGGER